MDKPRIITWGPTARRLGGAALFAVLAACKPAPSTDGAESSRSRGEAATAKAGTGDAAVAPPATAQIQNPADAPAAPPVNASAAATSKAAGKPVMPSLDFLPGPLYVCDVGGAREPIVFDPKVEGLCRRHPEMGPCQYERDACRQGGGRVYTARGEEVTSGVEAEYDRIVQRVRLRSN